MVLLIPAAVMALVAWNNHRAATTNPYESGLLVPGMIVYPYKQTIVVMADLSLDGRKERWACRMSRNRKSYWRCSAA